MKKFLIYILILTILVSSVYLPSSTKVAKADTGTILCAAMPVLCAGQALNSAANTAASQYVTETVGSFIQKSFAWLAYISLYASAWLTGLSGYLFDKAISVGALDMKVILDKGIGTAINNAWTVLRDVGNLSFIFILLYVAIRTILGIEGTDTKRLIRNVIIIGLLVNFSLFITKFLIDVSNITTIGIYKLFVAKTETIRSFSEQFAKPLGIQSVYDFDTFLKNMQTTNGNIWFKIGIVGIGGTTFLMITALTFLQAAALFLIRFVVLIFAMVVSALAFFAFVLPSTRSWFNKWWNMLSGQLFFAPIYMLLMYVVVQVTKNANFAGQNINTTIVDGILNTNTGAQFSSGVGASIPSVGATAGAAGAGLNNIVTNLTSFDSTSAIFNFIIIIALMIGASIVAMAVASRSGTLVTKAMTRARGYVSKGFATATVGTAGFVARNTAGRAASKLASEDSAMGSWLRRQQAKPGTGFLGIGIARRAAARAATKGLQKTGEASFDVRNTNAAQSFAKTTGVELGKGRGVGGYEKKLTEQKKYIMGNIEKSGGARPETQKELVNARYSVAEAEKRLQDKNLSMDDRIAAEETLIKERKRLKDAKTAKSREIRNQRIALATYLGTKSKFMGVNWGNFSTAGTKIARKYKEASAEYLAKTPEDRKKASDEEFDEYKERLEYYTKAGPAGEPSQYDKAKSDKDEKKKMDELIKKWIREKISKENRIKLSPKILGHEAIVKHLRSDDLTAISKKGEMTKEDYEAIATSAYRHNEQLRAYIKKAKDRSSDWYLSPEARSRLDEQIRRDEEGRGGTPGAGRGEGPTPPPIPGGGRGPRPDRGPRPPRTPGGRGAGGTPPPTAPAGPDPYGLAGPATLPYDVAPLPPDTYDLA
jgi:hypothetical protein